MSNRVPASIRRSAPLTLGKLLVVPLLAATTACIPTVKSVFVDLSYPDDPPKSAVRDVTLSLDAAISSSLLVAYERPRDAGACIAQLAGDPSVIDALWSYGTCVAEGGTRTQCLPRLPFIAAQSAASGAPFALKFTCAAAPQSDADQLELALSLDDNAVAAVGYQLAALGPSALYAKPPTDLAKALRLTLEHAARVLQADPVAVHDPNLPSVSVSGGAANGAFVAGFMYALLRLREQALFYGSSAQRAMLEKERFGSAFGSSVGSLVGLPLDLYFTDAAPLASLAPAIDACIREGRGRVTTGTARPLQDCALALLEHDFVANEWDLLCAQPGSALGLLKTNTKSLLRFDPLEKNQVNPFLQTFGALTRQNGFVRTVTATDLAQGMLATLDERACLIPGMNADQCAREGVLASVSEPVLAAPRPRVFSGASGIAGEKGVWLDGGLQSVNPASRAVAATHGKVLTLNTYRIFGTPVSSVEGLTPTTLGAMTTVGTRLIGWETSYAALEQHRRQRDACELGHLVGNESLCPATGAAKVGPSALSSGLLTVSVPDDIAPASLFASGYTFDPLVMRGLFLWGERSFLRSRAKVLQFLGWCVPGALERADFACPGGEGVSEAYATGVRAHEQQVTTEIESYRQYENPAVWKKHLEERKALVSERLTTCEGE